MEQTTCLCGIDGIKLCNHQRGFMLCVYKVKVKGFEIRGYT